MRFEAEFVRLVRGETELETWALAVADGPDEDIARADAPNDRRDLESALEGLCREHGGAAVAAALASTRAVLERVLRGEEAAAPAARGLPPMR